MWDLLQQRRAWLAAHGVQIGKAQAPPKGRAVGSARRCYRRVKQRLGQNPNIPHGGVLGQGLHIHR